MLKASKITNECFDCYSKEEGLKKLFISCPMRGRTEENIKKSMEKMQQIAEITFDQKLEVIPTYIEHIPPETKDRGIWCLGESIKKMAEADYFIGVEWSSSFKGCEIEREVAMEYNIPGTLVKIAELMPDAAAIERYERQDAIATSPGPCNCICGESNGEEK